MARYVSMVYSRAGAGSWAQPGRWPSVRRVGILATAASPPVPTGAFSKLDAVSHEVPDCTDQSRLAVRVHAAGRVRPSPKATRPTAATRPLDTAGQRRKWG